MILAVERQRHDGVVQEIIVRPGCGTRTRLNRSGQVDEYLQLILEYVGRERWRERLRQFRLQCALESLDWRSRRR
jgi:hypothetical protein